MRKVLETTETVMAKAANGALDGVGGVIDVAETGIEKTVAPIRKSIIKRFPTLFLLAVTFGVTAVGTGIQGLLLKHELLESHPEMIIGIGLMILILTGTVYKKLG